MTFYDLIDQVKAITETYTGGRIGFNYGTLKELNAIADKVLPMVYVVTDPEFVSIRPNGNTKTASLMYLVLDQQKLDDPAADTRNLQERLEPIGDGIWYLLCTDENLTVTNPEGSLKLKLFDDVLSGIGYRMNVTFPALDCDYPFTYEAE